MTGNRSSWRTCCSFAAIGAASIYASLLVEPAAAQDRSSPDEALHADDGRATALTDIIVTATRREERLQSVPIAVTALSNEVLQNRQITSVDALMRTTPNVFIAPFTDASTQLVTIRGISTGDNIATLDPATGIYLDGSYIARATGNNLSFIDVQRVEVLRGPQGTLFGRNTIGGAINIVTNQPTDEFEGWVKAGIGNFGLRNLTGVVNAPLSDTLAIRVVGNHNQHDGFARSSITNVDLNDTNDDYFRGAAKLDIDDGWSVILAGDYSSHKAAGQWMTQYVPFARGRDAVREFSGGTATLDQFVGPFDRNVPNATKGPFLASNWGISATINGELGTASLKSITSYRRATRSINNADQDGTPYYLAHLLLNATRQKQFSQEIQAYGTALGGRLDWIAGAYYFKETGTENIFALFTYPRTPNYFVNAGDAHNSSAGVFSQLTLAVTDNINVVAGIRYTHDTRQLDLRNRSVAVLPGADMAPGAVTACAVAGQQLPDCNLSTPTAKYNYVPFTIGIDFKPSPGTLLYAKWARGFRSGGYNLRATSATALIPFDPERLDTYELGAKVDIGRVARINAAFFHSKYHDQILNTSLLSPTGGGIALIQNAGQGQVNGAEIEATLALGDFTLAGNFGYIDAKYTKLLPSVVGVTLDSAFGGAPKFTYGINGSYDISTGLGDFKLNADYSWRDDAAFGSVPPGSPLLIAPAYGLANASILWKPKPNIDLAFWVRNLTDKKYISRVQNYQAVAGFLSIYPGDPRTFGASITYRFSAK